MRPPPLSALAAPKSPGPRTVPGRGSMHTWWREEENESVSWELPGPPHSDLINQLQEAPWCRSREQCGLWSGHKLWLHHIQLSSAEVIFTFWAFSYPSMKWG